MARAVRVALPRVPSVGQSQMFAGTGEVPGYVAQAAGIGKAVPPLHAAPS